MSRGVKLSKYWRLNQGEMLYVEIQDPMTRKNKDWNEQNNAPPFGRWDHQFPSIFIQGNLRDLNLGMEIREQDLQ